MPTDFLSYVVSPFLLRGALLAIEISVLAMAFGLVLGLGLALMRLSRHAWVRGPGGIREVPAGAIRDLKVSLQRNPISLLLAAERGTVRARLLPDIKDDTGTLRRALEMSGTDLDPVVLYIDPDTGLISKETYLAGGPGQPLIEELFSEYRPVDGVQVAYVTTIRRGGQPILEQRVRDITINGPLDSTLFERPTP